VGELKAIASPDDAAVWAHRILDAKNSLTEADARQVEDAFRVKLAALESAAGIDKSRLAHPEPRRFRDKEHVRFEAKQPCLICGRRL
jgi:hypothetical protein